MANGNNVEGQGRNGNNAKSRGAKWEFHPSFMKIPKRPYWPCDKKKKKGKLNNNNKMTKLSHLFQSN